MRSLDRHGHQRSVFGGIVLRFEIVDSTNNVAVRLGKQGLPEGAVVQARTQRFGRGRKGRRWFSPAGGLYFSVVLRPKMCSLVSLIPIAAGVSAARAIRRCFSIEAVLKWPNDVMVDNKKVAGILVESSLTPMECLAVTGFGVNANSFSTQTMPELADQAVSISDARGSIVDVDRLMREIVDDFAEIYKDMFSRSQLAVVNQWKEFSGMLSKPILVYEDENSFEAIAVDLDCDGALLVKTADGKLRRLLAGDVSTVRLLKT